MSRSHHARRWSPTVIGLIVVAIAGLIVPAASAATLSATATVLSDLQTQGKGNAGTDSTYTYTLTPASGQIGSFNLTAPAGWNFTGITGFSPAAGTVRFATGSTTVIEGRNLMITAMSPFQMTFTARAPCPDTKSVWTTAAKTGGSFTGNSFNVAGVPASITGTCTAAFDREPTDAAFNDPPDFKGPSENISSLAFTPDAAAIRVLVLDAASKPRPGISITLSLSPNPMALGGPITMTSDDSGYATFGSAQNPVTISELGQGYRMTPTGAGVQGSPQKLPFGIYQAGKPCTTDPCQVLARGGNTLTARIAAPAGGALGAFVASVSGIDVQCDGFTSPFNSTDSPPIVWRYTGNGSQTIVVDLSKFLMRQVLDRGSAHLDFCFDSEGKPFTDKFHAPHWGSSGNNTNGLLSDCNTGIDPNNCIVSETALSGGGRRVTVRVADGKGRL